MPIENKKFRAQHLIAQEKTAERLIVWLDNWTRARNLATGFFDVMDEENFRDSFKSVFFFIFGLEAEAVSLRVKEQDENYDRIACVAYHHAIGSSVPKRWKHMDFPGKFSLVTHLERIAKGEVESFLPEALLKHHMFFLRGVFEKSAILCELYQPTPPGQQPSSNNPGPKPS